MLGLSVTFDLDQNTICDKGGAEYTSEADAYWYTNDRVRSMGMHTARKIKMYRQLLTILRRMPERSDQRRFLSSVLGEDEDGACIHGIEDRDFMCHMARKDSAYAGLWRRNKRSFHSVFHLLSV